MSEQPEETIRQRAGKRRFIACTQSTGRIGKSTVAEGLISWLRYAEIEFAAIDADSQHQTLWHRYPDQVGISDATKTLDDFSRMIPNATGFTGDPRGFSRASDRLSFICCQSLPVAGIF